MTSFRVSALTIVVIVGISALLCHAGPKRNLKPRQEDHVTGDHLASRLVRREQAKAPAPMTANTAGGDALRLEGVVLDEAGVPAPGAFVHIVPQANSHPVWSSTDGSFVITGLNAGRYVVVATRGNYVGSGAMRLNATPDALIVTLHKGLVLSVRVVDSETHEPIPGSILHSISADATTGSDGVGNLMPLWPDNPSVEIVAPGYEPANLSITQVVEARTIEVVLQRGESVSGTVTDPSGVPLQGATVFLSHPGSGRTLSTKSDSAGEWKFGAVSVGKINVSASSEQYLESPVQQIFIDGRTPRPGVVLNLRYGAQIAGEIHLLSGVGCYGAEVSAALKGVASEGILRHTTADSTARFELPGLKPGTYAISARCPTANAASDQLVVTVSDGERAEILLEARDSEIEGLVVDESGVPVQHATVVAFPKGGLMCDELVATTNPQGRFMFLGVVPGTYELLAREDRGSSERVTVQTGDKDASLVLRLAKESSLPK